MYGVMGSWQINMLADVFGKESLKVTTFNVDVPPQFSLNWEMVASPSQSVWVLNSYFLDNMEEYRHNKFINIGIQAMSELCKELHCRSVSPLLIPVQEYIGSAQRSPCV